MINRSLHPLHFDDFEGHQFERLVFAYMLRTDNWLSLEWYGQAGGDSGRDIWGVRERDNFSQGQKVCIQCSNSKKLTYKKLKDDIEKVVNSQNGKPDIFIVVTGSKVSASLRDKVNKFCEQKEIYNNEIWSGNEFEERLRSEAEQLLKRFIEGETFPDSPNDLRSFVMSATPQTDPEILALIAGLFDRPAFYTPFNRESSIPAFKKAITDTIEALNTGVHRLRDGTEIRRIPSRNMIKSPEIKKSLGKIERSLAELRARYEELLKQGEIQPCGCNDPDCPVFFCSVHAAREMDHIREKILNDFHRLYPDFDIKMGWRN